MRQETSSFIEPGRLGGININEAITSFARHLKAENLSPRTIQTYTKSASQLATFLREQGMPDDVGLITREHIESFIIDLQERWKPSTAANRYGGLRALFAWLSEEGEIRESPMRRMSPRRSRFTRRPSCEMTSCGNC